jgi:hypothetical protein
VIQIGNEIHKMILSFDILDGADDNNTITRNNFLEVTKIMCGINSYLTGTQYDERQVDAIVDYLILDIDNDKNSEIDLIEFYDYYRKSKNADEFFQMLYGKGIENKISNKVITEEQKQNRKELVKIYKQLMTYMQYFRSNLMGPIQDGHVYPSIKEE